MLTISIKDKNILKIEDENNNTIIYGSNQMWFKKRWQRMSGCGPSAVVNILYYLNCTRGNMPSCSNLTKSECLALMDELWSYITPGLGGISSTGMLRNGIQKYLLYKSINIKLESLDVPKKKAFRPDLHKVVTFLANSLKSDSPVAFLNLEHGTILDLDSWHWVTIISLEYDLDEEVAFVGILDGGLEKRIDLSKWLHLTKLGGGFVSFELL